jgi:DNA repair exonuclease SbcCD ATPase subunit
MLKLKKLLFKNIGRFLEQQEIDFTSLGSLIQIDALNNCTGGSSGAGKSTIFNAIDYLLGISDLSFWTLQSRLTRESITVEGFFDWDGKEVRIHRNRKLSVTIDGVETSGSSKLAEEELDKIIGMPRNLFRQLLHRRQGDGGFFLLQSPAQMNSFLTDCLNLGLVRSKVDVIDEKIKDLDQIKTTAVNTLQASQAALEATKSAQASLGQEPTTNVTSADVDVLKVKLESFQDTLKTLLVHNQTQEKSLQAKKPRYTIEPYNRVRFDSIEADMKALDIQIEAETDKERFRQREVNNLISEIKLSTATKISTLKLEYSHKISEFKNVTNKLNNIVQLGKSSKETAIQLAQKIKVQRNGICHTCERSWITDEAKKEETRLLEELGQHKINIEASTKAALEIEEVKTIILETTNQLNTEVAGLTAKMTSETAGLELQLKPRVSSEIIRLESNLSELSKQKKAEFVKEDEHQTQQNKNAQKLVEAFFLEQKALTDKHQIAVDSVTRDLNEAKGQYEQNAQVLGAHLIAFNRYKTSFESLKKKEDEIALKIGDATSKIGTLTEDLEIAEEVKRCLKSYLSCSFDDALESISHAATEILRSIPTMANATIRLQSTKETGSGSLKEVVNAVLDNDGELEVPIKSLSGGERSAVDLSLDLAVTSFIEERTNIGTDFLCLDEIFNGFDSLGIEQALEMLKTFAVNKRLLLVEHDGVAKEFIQDRITVIREGETSYIK